MHPSRLHRPPRLAALLLLVAVAVPFSLELPVEGLPGTPFWVVASSGVRASETPVLPSLPDGPAPHEVDRSPLGLPEVEAPQGARVELGRRLFFDPLLSADRTVSCASCHRPDHGYASPEPRSTGVRGQTTERNAPSLLNRAYGERFMWDGRFERLTDQVLEPIHNPREMDLPLADALERLREDAGYREAFAGAYPDGVTRANLADALAAFVGRLRLGNSAIDRFQAALEPLSAEEKSGLWIYESKGGCWRCHSGPNLTDEDFHNTGVGAVDGRPEPGRFAVTGDEADRGRFKTPTLRGLEMTAPYMHDGSLATLEQVVAFYRRGGNANPGLDPAMRPLDLTDEEARNLVAFLRALSRPVP